jgi:hypothetical protein
MSKKLLIGVAPLFAIAAFAAMPVAAQAEIQHWYRNGVLLPEGTAMPFVTFGNRINLNQKSALGEVNCKTAGGGTIENPTGAGAGIGGMTALAFYDCKAPQCEEAVLKEFGLEGREWVEAKNISASINGHPERRFVPWLMQLEESIVEGINSVRLRIGVPWGGIFETPSPPGMIRISQACEIAASETPLNQFTSEGELKPEIGVAFKGNMNGTSPGKPSFYTFQGPSTEALHSMAVGLVTYTNSLKYLGYNEQELITVKP